MLMDWLLVVALVDCLTCMPVKTVKFATYRECAEMRDNVAEAGRTYGYRKLRAECHYAGGRPPVWPVYPPD